jgi:patatin-like phospholipase/acyl hydrolase
MAPEPKRFRILSLDGGGIKGAFTAAVLAEWENKTGRVIVDHFDLITGTSTGGIIALGLGLGIPAEQILRFYKEQGPKIFPNITPQQKLSLNIRHLWEPKYSAEPLREALQGVFGDKRLKDAKCRLLIPTTWWQDAYTCLRPVMTVVSCLMKTLWQLRSLWRPLLHPLFSNRPKCPFGRDLRRRRRVGQLPRLGCGHRGR